MSSFLVKIKPLEPYFFGNERSSNFGKEKQQAREKYYISSNNIPAQTTLLGMLRKIIIESKGLLNLDFKYSKTKCEIDKLIGEKSFNFETKDMDFGIIEKLHPLFLIDNKNNYYIKTPFDHKVSENDKKVGERYNYFEKIIKIETNMGTKSIPEGFAGKNGVTDSYMSLDGEIKELSEIFKNNLRVGICKVNKLDVNDNKDAFVKKESKVLKEDFSFAFFADIEDDETLPSKYLAKLGQGNSLFEVSIEKKENDLIDKVKSLLNSGEKRKYVLSPSLFNSRLFCEKEKNVTGFEGAILNTREFRYLKLNQEAKNYYERYKKSSVLCNIVTEGSIIYDKKSIDEIENMLDYNINLKKIGMNNIIEIGGN